jgi:hypothetical protein
MSSAPTCLVRAVAVLVVAGCTSAAPPAPEPPLPIDAIWGASIAPGDLIVAVPGTGAYDLLGKIIDDAAANGPVLVDERVTPQLNPIVLEQAIAAAQRAGLSDDDIAAGAVTIGLWGAGVTKVARFQYRSLGGLLIDVDVLGGQNACAAGQIAQNILHYTRDNADADARDLLARTAALHPARVTMVAHSWGGAVVEHVVLNRMFDDSLAFVVAAGVPKAIVGEGMVGPTLRPEGSATLYEVDRPDDPVHALDFAWDIEGHQYDIMWGDTFQGSYGITTSELSCHAQPGACPTN